MIKRRFYAECNKYGLNLSHDSVGWRLFAFDRREHRDKFVDHMNEVSDRPVAQDRDPGILIPGRPVIRVVELPAHHKGGQVRRVVQGRAVGL